MVDLHLTNVMIQSLTNQLCNNKLNSVEQIACVFCIYYSNSQPCNNIFYSFKVIGVFLLLDDYINVVTFTIVY